MSATLVDELETAGEPDVTAPPPAADDGWRTHKNGKQYIPGSKGIIYREGSETIEEAKVRDARGPRDKPPKRKPKPPAAGKLPPKPTEISLQQLEYELAEALSSPANMAAAAGDQYMADHFAREGPRLARHIVVAAKYNPWLLRKLEAAAIGDADVLIRVIMSMGLAGALVSYSIVPVVYYLDPPFISQRARAMYRIPERHPEDQEAPGAESPEAPTGAEAALAA